MGQIQLAMALSVAAAATRLAPDPGVQARATSPDSEVAASVAAVATYLDRAAAFGLSGAILIEHHGKVLLEGGYGVADREAGDRISPETPFFIGSLAKQFTAAAILRLEMEGRLAVTDSLGKWLPDVPADKRAITLHELLTHTSGLPFLVSRSLAEPVPRVEVVREVMALPLLFAPGSGYAYSSAGYTLLAAVVERASGQTYEAYVAHELFDRAAMAHTAFIGSPAVRRNATHVHSYSDGLDEGALGEQPAFDRGVGAGTVVTTVGDFGRWFDAVRARRVLDARETNNFFAPPTEAAGLTVAYAWKVGVTQQGDTVDYQVGDIGGYNVECRWDRRRDLLIVFFSNARTGEGGYREAVMPRVTELMAGATVAMPPATTTAGPSEANVQDSGTYVLPSHAMLQVAPGAHGLLVMGDGQDALTRLSGLAPGDPAAAALPRHAEALLGAFAHSDTAALNAEVRADPSQAPILSAAAAAWNALVDTLGAVRTLHIVGTRIGRGGNGFTRARLDLEHGTRRLTYVWRHDRLFLTVPAAAERDLFVAEPGSAHSYVSYDPFSQRIVRLVFGSPSSDRATPAGGVEIDAGGERVRAVRVDPGTAKDLAGVQGTQGPR